MSKELIDRLKSYIPSGDGHNSQYANDLADAVELLEAADALEAKAAPVAYITGQFAGRCVIEAINRAAVLPTGMALYATPQPSAVPDVSAMARILSDRAADACNIDHADNWAMYGQEYIDDVQAMLAAAPPAQATVQSDADNYRWLREQHNNVNSDIGVYNGINILATSDGELDLDAAIAAARQEGKV